MSETLRTDGGAVEVDLTSTVAKGDIAYLDGFRGILMQAGSSGETVAMEIAQRVHEISIGDLTGAKGDIIYMDDTGALSNDDTDAAFMKVVVAKDGNGYIWGLLLPQTA